MKQLPRRTVDFQLPKSVIVFLAGTTFVLALLPINNYFRQSTKDYAKWYRVGQTVLEGGDIYALRGDGTFRFMYPPPAAVFFALPSYFGELALIIVLVLLYSAAWVASVLLSVFLATGTAARASPLLYFIPGICCMPYVVDNYLLGQPNLFLLALMLGAFECLRRGREWSAGALVALATAIKAFPVLAMAYLVYRRYWRATLSALAVLILLLVVFPAPFRGFDRNVEDLHTWTRGMLRYDAESISQRERRGFSWSNHSLVAVAHRLLRPVNAHRKRDETLFVNVADLDFRHVTALIAVIGACLCLLYIACMPRREKRTTRSDAIEQALLLLLILIFTPLAFTYFFVWLLLPLAVALDIVLRARSGTAQRTKRWVWFWAGVIPLSFTIPISVLRPFQASGSTLLACLVLLAGLGYHLRTGAGEDSVASRQIEAKNRVT